MPRTVLITGAASGIGRATALAFASRGWSVAATARDPERLRSWIEPSGVALRLDVTDEGSIGAAVAATVERFGAIDVLVNNAGTGLFGPLEGASADRILRTFRTNVLGVAATIRHVLPIMRERRSGTIVNVSSIAGRIAGPFSSVYDASKHALEGLSESLRYELGLHGIRVKLVEPGHYKTDFLSRSIEWSAHPAYEAERRNWNEWMDHTDETSPSPEPVAATIVRAATDGSRRLRYVVGGRLFLAIHALLPDAAWRAMMGSGMTHRPKRRGEKSSTKEKDETLGRS